VAGLQDGASDIAAKLGARQLEVRAGGSQFPGNPFFRGANFSGGPPAAFADARQALREHLLPRRLLPGIDFTARFLEGFLVGTDFFLRGGLACFGGALGAEGAFAPLGHHALERFEEVGAKEQIKKKDDQDCGYSLQEQFAKLMNNFHPVVMPERGGWRRCHTRIEPPAALRAKLGTRQRKLL